MAATEPRRPSLYFGFYPSLGRSSHAKADGRGLLIPPAADSRRGPNLAGSIFPRSAAHYVLAAILGEIRPSVGRRIIGISVVPAIFHPFPHIAVHIVQSERIRGKTAYRKRLLTIRTGRPVPITGAAVVVRLFGGDGRPKRQWRRGSGARGIFPFGFRWQAIWLSGFFAQPRGIALGLVPGDADDGPRSPSPALVVGCRPIAAAAGDAGIP